MKLIRLIGGRCARVLAGAGRAARTRFFPERDHPPLYRGTMLDDLLWGQVFNPVMRMVWALGRRRQAKPGTTVVIVSWNTCEVLQSVLAAVRHHSPANLELIVIDNGSTDGTRHWLKTQSLTTRCVRLPFNIGHGRGLDLGFALARTSTVITMDSDAFPFSPDWTRHLDHALEPGHIVAAGMWGRRDRLHPACAAFQRAAFYDAKISFNNYTPWMDRGEQPEFGVNSWDTAELLFETLGRERVALLEVEASPHGGSTMAGVVYHHEQMTTVQTDMPKQTGADRRQTWDSAVRDLIGAD